MKFRVLINLEMVNSKTFYCDCSQSRFQNTWSLMWVTWIPKSTIIFIVDSKILMCIKYKCHQKQNGKNSRHLKLEERVRYSEKLPLVGMTVATVSFLCLYSKKVTHTKKRNTCNVMHCEQSCECFLEIEERKQINIYFSHFVWFVWDEEVEK